MNLQVRAIRLALDREARELIRRRIWFALGRFQNRVGRVAVDVEDLNADRGGLDKRCRIVARLAPRGELAAEAVDRDIAAAVCRAVDRLGRSVARAIDRRRDRKGRIAIDGFA